MLTAHKALVAATFLSLVTLLPPARAVPPWEPEAPVAERDGPALGVLVDEIPFGRLDAMGLSYGVEVSRVIPGSPARESGLQSGDILIEINDEAVFSVPRLRWLVGQADPDTTLVVTYSRAGTLATVKIAPRRIQTGSAPSPHRRDQWDWTSPGYLGIRLQSLTPGLREAFDIPRDSGALVAEVYAGSPADEAGLRAGDVLVRMDRRRIRGIADVERVVDYFGPGETIDVEIVRDRRSQTLTIELGDVPGAGDHGRSQPWSPSERGAMPFFSDPHWWRNMEQLMEEWRQYWEESQDVPLDKAL